MVAVVGVNTQLVNDLEGVFAPVFDIDQGVVQGGAIFALQVALLAQGLRSGEHVSGDYVIAQMGEFGIREADTV